MDDNTIETEELKSRPYQALLEEVSIAKNTIIHLPTGSGKTFIAICVINRFKESLQKPWGKGGKRTFFLVNTIPLVNQQKKVVQKLSQINSDKIIGYSGEDGIDYWNKTKWDSEMEKYQVIVMTSQILADMLTHHYIRIQDINLLIFDECHHAVVDHPMRLVMKNFENCPVQQQPRVLGLTATLLNANVTKWKVEETLRVLETTFHATIATVDELGEVLNYSTNPNEIIRFYRTVAPSRSAAEAIELLNELSRMVYNVKLPSAIGNLEIKLEHGQRDITTDPKKIVKEVSNMCTAMIRFIEELGMYGGALSIVAYIILMERLKRKAISAEEERLYRLCITHCIHARMILLEAMDNDTGYNKIVKHSSPKILELLAILKEYNPEVYNSPGVLLKVNTNRQPLSGIIFTIQRFTAKVLYNLLKEVIVENPKDFGFLKHDFIVGFNLNPFKSTREQYFAKKSSETALLRFCNKELNCLISTCVIEEGVDIPQCLLVLRYDAPLEYRSYIQSKGRARSADSSFVLLIDEQEKKKFGERYRTFQETERHLQNLLFGQADDRHAPTQEQIQDILYDDDEIPPYITKDGLRLSSVSAISLLNRYCSLLPHDQFTVISPMWIQELVADQQKGQLKLIKIYMPIACPIKQVIEGIPTVSFRNAKRAAALNACKLLHQAGELKDDLLPKLYAKVDFDQPEVQSCFPNWPWNQVELEGDDIPKAGTKSRVRKHARVFPSYLRNSPDDRSDTYYLHVIKLNTAFEEPKDSRERALYKLLRKDEGYAFLTPKPLPKLCAFSLFLTVGEVTTSLEVNYAVIQLNDQLINLLKSFHLFLFDEVLEVVKKFTVFDTTENCMYVVPIIASSGYDIDWKTMQTYAQAGIPPLFEPSFEERCSLRVEPEDYNCKVVSPWYRGSILPVRYIVTNVLEYLTPNSLFDPNNEDMGTYADYYRLKYNLEITGRQDQPLLEVRNISSRMNCLMPRSVTISSLTDKQQKMISNAQGDDKPKGFAEVFIPEFCTVYDFPGVFWYKAMLLPSIIHRVSMLLVAYELRAQIAKGTNYGVQQLSKKEEWAPLGMNQYITKRALLSQIEEPPQTMYIDRINNPNGDEEPPRTTSNVRMKETAYQLQKNKINKQYPWDETMEPLDIERNISTVTVMDIECYDEFVSALMPNTSASSASPIRHPTASTSAAILPPPIKYNDKLRILGLTLNGRGPELASILSALTTIRSNDIFDLEQCETLGDAFLKFAATLYTYHKFPKLNEGQLTNIKCRLVGNRNLFYAGAKAKLGGCMKVEQFSPRKDFLTPGCFAPRELQKFMEDQVIRPTFMIGLEFSHGEVMSGELSGESMKMIKARFEENDGNVECEPAYAAQSPLQCYVHAQAVSDKSVADCVEAFVGTYLLSGGILAGVKVLEWFKILPKKDEFATYLHKQIPTVLSMGHTTVQEIDRIMNYCRSDVEEILKYKFRDPSYLLEALSHSSYIRNRLTRSYERFEYLGDAILDFLITAHIFETYPSLKPGELTDLRSALVNNVTFASYVVKLGLNKYMCYQLNPVLENAILAFIDHQERRNYEIVEDILYLIDEEDCHIAEYIEVPKVLSDIFESLVAAIYLDSGGNLKTVWSVVYRIMHREIDVFSQNVPIQPVRLLLENIHACAAFGPPLVANPDVQKVMIPVTFTKQGRQETVYGCGSRKFEAKRAGAKLALKLLGL